MAIRFVGDWLPGGTVLCAGSSTSYVIGNLECAFAREKVNSAKAYTAVLPMEAIEKARKELEDWNTWKWARKVGPFNLKKNTASWKLRLKKNFIKTFPKFLVWQFLPQTLLFRIASIWR